MKDPILRDFFMTSDGLIFSVIDYFHPPEGIRSMLRYIPDASGPRIRKESGQKYRKAEFCDTFIYLKEAHPNWVDEVAVVPREEIIQIFKPTEAAAEIAGGKRTHPEAAELIRRMKHAGIPAAAIGVSGSLLPGLENEESDMDFVVYGKMWRAAREKLREMKNEPDPSGSRYAVAELDEPMWQKVYAKRKSPLPFELFRAHELRKGNRGMMIRDDGKKTYFDLLYARSEVPGVPVSRGRDTEKTVIEAVVIEDDFSFDSPAVYLIDHAEIDEIYSYTHTYAGQALKGEKIRARGRIEEIGNRKRLVIGTTREAPDEWMISLSLTEEGGKRFKK